MSGNPNSSHATSADDNSSESYDLVEDTLRELQEFASDSEEEVSDESRSFPSNLSLVEEEDLSSSSLSEGRESDSEEENVKEIIEGRIQELEESIRTAKHPVFEEEELATLLYKREQITESLKRVIAAPPEPVTVASQKIHLPKRTVIKERGQLDAILKETQGAVIFYSGKLENSLLTEHPTNAFMFGDNGNFAVKLHKNLKMQAEKLLGPAAKGEEVDAKIKEFRRNLDPETSYVCQTSHKGKGQAVMLKGKSGQHYYPNALGVVTCDLKFKQATDEQNAHYMKRSITSTFNHACALIANYNANIVIPVDANTGKTSMGAGRALKGNRQPESFKGEDVVSYIERRINELRKFALRHAEERSSSHSEDKEQGFRARITNERAASPSSPSSPIRPPQ